MRWTIAIALAALPTLFAARPAAAEPPPLSTPAFLNIGLGCRWEMRCMNAQRRAMGSALAFVRNTRPPAWRVQLCNRNAGRGYQRVDWVGFDHCIRNKSLPRTRAAPTARSGPRQNRRGRVY